MHCMHETPAQSLATALPHIATVGRHRIGRVLERVATGFGAQARIHPISASFDTAIDAVLALHAHTPIDALVVRQPAPARPGRALVH